MEYQVIVYSVIALILLTVVLPIISGIFFTVQQQTAAVVERFGKFIYIAKPGLNLKIPLIDKVARRLDLRIKQMVVQVETKTKDNVFVRVHIAVQYYVLQTRLHDAFYKLSDPYAQVESHVLDIVRGQVPKMDLDHVFENKDSIARAVKEELSELMTEFGYGIQTTLVTEIDPDEKVKFAMNDINAAQRERIAANERGEAERILAVKKAQGESQSKELQGMGIANQRKAIIEGLQQSVEIFSKNVPGVNPDDVMRMVLMTQYLDTMKEIGAAGNSNIVFMPHTPGALADLTSQITSALMATKTHS